MDINLGKKLDYSSPCCPCPSEKPEGKVIYPSLYIDQDGTELNDIPDEGTMTIRYRTCSKTSREKDGKKSVCLELEVISIVDAQEKSKAREDKIDDLRKKVTSKDEEDSEEGEY